MIRCRIFCLPVCYQKNIKIKICRTTVLPIVLCGCETWPFTQGKERRLRVTENRMLRRIFEITKEWKKLHSEELNGLYSSQNVIRIIKSRRMRWVGHVARMGESIGVYRVLVGKPEGKRPQGKPRRRWEENIMMDLQEVGWVALRLRIGSWRALVKVVMNVRVP